MKILDGRVLSGQIEVNLCAKVAQLKANNITPKLCVVLVGENPASQSYVNMKAKACKRVGIESHLFTLPSSVKQDELLKLIDRLNNDNSVNGILIQLPLPSHIDTNVILESVATSKDVDGFHPYNVGKLVANFKSSDYFIPATPLGVMKLLRANHIEVKGKDVVIIGASNIVGKPLFALMLNAGASVSMCHILTKDIRSYTLNADIVCVGVGCVNLIKADMIKDGAIIVDIGINKLENGVIVGDVDFENVSKKASFITPVPGGVGPMTIATLLANTLKAAILQAPKDCRIHNDICDDLFYPNNNPNQSSDFSHHSNQKG